LIEEMDVEYCEKKKGCQNLMAQPFIANWKALEEDVLMLPIL
jgi:hypothetical protein